MCCLWKLLEYKQYIILHYIIILVYISETVEKCLSLHLSCSTFWQTSEKFLTFLMLMFFFKSRFFVRQNQKKVSVFLEGLPINRLNVVPDQQGQCTLCWLHTDPACFQCERITGYRCVWCSDLLCWCCCVLCLSSLVIICQINCQLAVGAFTCIPKH